MVVRSGTMLQIGRDDKMYDENNYGITREVMRKQYKISNSKTTGFGEIAKMLVIPWLEPRVSWLHTGK